MIHESYPWKQDLLRRKRLILKYNCANLLSDDSAYTVIEKAVFYSAFIIRKLIDCRVKVSDEVDAYKFTLNLNKAVGIARRVRAGQFQLPYVSPAA